MVSSSHFATPRVKETTEQHSKKPNTPCWPLCQMPFLAEPMAPSALWAHPMKGPDLTHEPGGQPQHRAHRHALARLLCLVHRCAAQGTFCSTQHRGFIAARTFGNREPPCGHFFHHLWETEALHIGSLSRISENNFFVLFRAIPNIQEFRVLKWCTSSHGMFGLLPPGKWPVVGCTPVSKQGRGEARCAM